MIKPIKTLTLLILISLVGAGCSESKDDSAPTQEQNEETPPSYEGNWEGTFSGDDSGTWEMVVDENGDFEGFLFSDNSQSNYPLEGSIDKDGVFSAVIHIGTTLLDFSGQGTDGTSASGNWSNPDQLIKGSWTGTKK